MVCEHTTYTPTDRYRSVDKSVYGRGGGPPLPYTQMYTVAGTEAQRAGAATVYIFGSADANRQPHHRTPGTLSYYSPTIAILIFTSSGAQATLSGFEPSCYGPRLACQI